MKSIADNSIDLTVTSPPYDTLRNHIMNKITKEIYDDYSFPFVDMATIIPNYKRRWYSYLGCK
jgi:DNA modification methylase